MKCTAGRTEIGSHGSATEVLIELESSDHVDQQGTVGAWFLHCPGQSPAWDYYVLAVVHLRPIDGESKPAAITLPGASHELLLYACDPKGEPTALHPPSWHPLRPFNAVEQFTVPSDDEASELLWLCARAIVNGHLPAEPPLSGAREPWHTSVIKTSAHLRGEEHAP